MNAAVGTADGVHRPGSGTALEGHSVTAVAGGWVLLDGRVVWHDGEEAAIEGPQGTCLLPVDGGVVVGTAEAHLLGLPGGRMESFDRAPARDTWYTPWGGPPDTRSMATAPDGTLYVNVHVGGILRSTDGGDSWEPTLDIDLDVHQVVVAPDGVVLAACAYGLAVSRDGGDTWSVDDEGLHATYARAVAVAGDTVLLSASTGPGGRRAAVYRRPLAGGPFARATAGLPEWFTGNVDTACLSADGDTALLGTADGSVWASDDAGTTWSVLVSGLPRVTCVALDLRTSG
jgi:photosystem II stability/assembly factor-like uncharacterized protein